MIVFRQVDARYPFLWEDDAQPAGRWHGDREGPAHYFADTPDGAWAEFLRHEEIEDPADLPTIRRQLWAVDIGDDEAVPVEIAASALAGPDSYPRCQQRARTLRAKGATRLIAPSAALRPGAAGGWRVHNGLRPDHPRDGRVIVVFGAPEGLTGWVAAVDGRPPDDLLPRVRALTA